MSPIRHVPSTMSRRAASQRGMSLIEILVAVTMITMMIASVYASFSTTATSMRHAEKVQQKYAVLRNCLARMGAELSMAYLSHNRPAGDEKHYTLFEGRDLFYSDSLTFSAFAHIRMRKDANESDQSVIQYFLFKDPNDGTRTHLYKREARRLMGDLPEKLEEFFPAYVFCEDIKSFDVKYWDNKRIEWRDEWRTMKQDMQPNRLPERVKITLGVWDPDLGKEVKYVTQALIPLQERIDFSR
ncbi:prepilin-type N-terminal cleavage/methylation domain-containing protein [Nannocystis sp. SCPEA4]|uniref:prepilin-type N-terminal cleavage/methylation domain-containing protein n=1 Tax=Nannocystis sp. SCPEA4 TaxID=2996787 RepID=UPI00226DD122|nr:prepilin-type N-terminal cleavage/methylation domain-containing protein [Nannocystis sp. SCPEA4]MCY1062548.1 prepilin-type N-terminal cleavage/methylation domain-containing protein [Nannocystis sp. SCPEA4]